jgi:hypothetical protein
VHRRFLLVPLVLSLVCGGVPAAPVAGAFDLPASLTDKELWTLIEDMSEPNGSFQSDNLLSNELVFTRIVPDLVARVKPGGVYLGVGPEQNFTYMAAIRPRIAFIPDIRRGNLHMQLMYKALFELSTDRADFVSRLFTKPRPRGLTTTSSVTELMTAYWDVATASEAAFNANLDAIQRHLTKTHSLPLSSEDLDGVARVYRTFYWYGPAMTYAASTSLAMPAAPARGTNYWDLMTQGDATGQAFSYLASEDRYLFLKELQRKNLVVPLVGNFSGPKALRAIGAYLKARDARVSAFYLSNVEQYLVREGKWPAFCANVASLPLDEASVFIRPSRTPTMGITRFVYNPGAPLVYPPPATPPPPSGPAPGTGTGLVRMADEVRACAAATGSGASSAHIPTPRRTG